MGRLVGVVCLLLSGCLKPPKAVAPDAGLPATVASTASSTGSHGTSGGPASSSGASSGSASTGGSSATSVSSGTSGATASSASTSASSGSTGSSGATTTAGATSASGTTSAASTGTSSSSTTATDATVGATGTGSSGTTTGTTGTTSSATTTGTSGTTSTATTGTTGTSGTTGSTGAPGETCGPALQALSEGPAVNGDTTAAADDYSTSNGANLCFSFPSAGGHDLVYAFTPPATGSYRFILTPLNSGPRAWDAALYVVAASACSPTAITACVGGADLHGPGLSETLDLALDAQTTYQVIVDGHASGDFGPYSLGVQQIFNNEVCGPGLPALAVGVPASGDTASAQNDYSSSAGTNPCLGSGAEGPDLVYAFTAPATGSYRFTLTPAGWDGALYLTDVAACSSTAISACLGAADVGFAGDPESLGASLTQGTTYYVVIDGYDTTSSGTFTLEVEPVQGGDCSSAQALTPHQVGDSQTVSGDTTGAGNEGTSACAGDTTEDLVYSLSPTEDVALTATLTLAANATGALYLRGACGDPASSLGCGDNLNGGSTVTLALPWVAGGQSYALWVDADPGSYTLSVQLGAPQAPRPGDSCQVLATDGGANDLALRPLPDGGAYGDVVVDNSLYVDNSHSALEGLCAGYGFGGDVAFRVSLAGPVPSLTATLTPSVGSALSPVVYIRQGPCLNEAPADGGVGGELACDMTDGLATARTGPLPAGDYFIWADSISTGQGPGVLAVSVP